MGGNYVRDPLIDIHHYLYHLAFRCHLCCRDGRDTCVDGTEKCDKCSAVRELSEIIGGGDGKCDGDKGMEDV